MRGALGDDEQVTGLQLHLLLAQPFATGAFHHVLQFVRFGVVVAAGDAGLDAEGGAVGGGEVSRA